MAGSNIKGKNPRPIPEIPQHFFKKCATSEPLEAVDVRDFVRMPLPKPKPMMGNWLLNQSLCMIHGARGEGKTFLALWIACAVASGRDLLGWKSSGPKKVVYLDGEMSSAMFQARIKALPKHMRPVQGMLKVVTPDLQPGVLPDLSLMDEQDLINAAIDPETELIIVDNLSSWSKSGREDSETWAPIAAWALRHRAEGRSIIFIHHSGKSGTQRGTSRREDLLDVVLALRKPPAAQASDGACFEVRFEKNRHLSGAEVSPIQVQLVTDENGKHDWIWSEIQDQHEERLERIFQLKEQGLNQSEIAREIGVDKATVSRALNSSRK